MIWFFPFVLLASLLTRAAQGWLPHRVGNYLLNQSLRLFTWTHVGFEPLLLRAKESCRRYTTWPIVLLLLLVGVTPIHHRVLPKACINLLETLSGQSQGLLIPSIPTEEYFRTFTIVIWHHWLTEKERETRIRRLPGKIGSRACRTRTCDLLVPNQARYQLR